MALWGPTRFNGLSPSHLGSVGADGRHAKATKQHPNSHVTRVLSSVSYPKWTIQSLQAPLAAGQTPFPRNSLCQSLADIVTLTVECRARGPLGRRHGIPVLCPSFSPRPPPLVRCPSQSPAQTTHPTTRGEAEGRERSRRAQRNAGSLSHTLPVPSLFLFLAPLSSRVHFFLLARPITDPDSRRLNSSPTLRTCT